MYSLGPARRIGKLVARKVSGKLVSRHLGSSFADLISSRSTNVNNCNGLVFGAPRAAPWLIFVGGSAVRKEVVPRRVPKRHRLPRSAEKLGDLSNPGF